MKIENQNIKNFISSVIIPLFIILLTTSFVTNSDITTENINKTFNSQFELLIKTFLGILILVANCILFIKLLRLPYEVTYIKNFKFRDIPSSLINAAVYTLVLFIINIAFSFIYDYFNTKFNILPSESFNLQITNRSPALLSLIGINCILTGYSEELLFRSFFLGNAARFYGKKTSTILTSITFGLCHLYQGTDAVINIVLISVVLSYIFFKYKNIHISAITHGLYDFSIFAMCFFNIL